MWCYLLAAGQQSWLTKKSGLVHLSRILRLYIRLYTKYHLILVNTIGYTIAFPFQTVFYCEPIFIERAVVGEKTQASDIMIFRSVAIGDAEVSHPYYLEKICRGVASLIFRENM